MDNGGIFNKYLWKVCPYEVMAHQSSDLCSLQAKKKDCLVKYNAVHWTQSIGNEANKCSQAVSEVRKIKDGCSEELKWITPW